MNQQSAKNLLFNFSGLSPEKAFVSCQINRWIQTKKKSDSPVRQRNIKKMPAKTLMLDENNFESLKRRRQQLLKSSNKKAQRSVQTKPSSSAATPATVRRLVDNLPMIRVSQFNPGQNQRNSLKKIFSKNQPPGWINEAKRKNTRRKCMSKFGGKQIEAHNNFQNRIIINTSDLLRSHSQEYCGAIRLRKKQLNPKKLIIS